MRPWVQTARACSKGLSACFWIWKLKLHYKLHDTSASAYELEDDFNEVFEHVELESMSKDSSDSAIWVAKTPTAHEDVLEVASKDRKGGELGEAGSCYEHSWGGGGA